MRTNYVLIDYENVQPESLEALDGEHFKLMVFVGASQAKLHFEVAAAVQRLGNRAEYIKISGNGANSLDFHIAFYIGKLAAEEPSAYFHIVSKDTGFDPLILHLKTRNIGVRRVKSVAEILPVRNHADVSFLERREVVLTRLRRLKEAKPKTLKTLNSTIIAIFRNQVTEEDVKGLIDDLVEQGTLSITGSTIVYFLSGEESEPTQKS